MREDVSAAMLLERVFTGDEDALTALYDMYERLVYSFAYKCIGDASGAEEVVQDVFLKIWKTTARYNMAQGKVTTWILSITRNVAIDYHRRTKRHQIDAMEGDEPLIHVSDSVPGPDDLAEAAQTRQTIKNAMASLPDEQRQIVEAIYFHGRTQKETSDILGIPPGTVKSRVRLAMTKLRSQLPSETGVNNSV